MASNDINSAISTVTTKATEFLKTLGTAKPAEEVKTETEGAPEDTFTPTGSDDLYAQIGGYIKKGLAALGSSSSTTASAPATFSGTVRDNFAAIDKDANGYLSEGEIDGALIDRSFQGDDAAAIATLKAQRDTLQGTADDEYGFENDGVTLNDMDAYDRLVAKGDNSAGQVENTFGWAQNKIGNQSQQLFANGKPTANTLKQGLIGDCYFLASLENKVYQDPEAVKKMITANADGTYTVHFPSRGDVKVDRPTDGEIAFYGGSGKDGLWGEVIEKGYGTLKNAAARKISPMDSADGGDPNSEGISAMTGHGVDADFTSVTSDDTTRAKLTAAMEDGRMVQAGIRGNLPLTDDERNGLPMGHAYSVLDYDAETDVVTLRNPWGYNEPTYSDGSTSDGVDDGVFRMTLESFTQNFTEVAYEEAE